MFSILHITDLHRAKNDPISNSELVSALVSDRESFDREDPPIPPPDAIVVSGDIIQGVGLGAANYQAELEDQYRTAHEFLVEIADRFLGGDRSKVVIVPGNHDINWNVAFDAMERIDEPDTLKGLPSVLHFPDSPYRWDWKSRNLYRIKNTAAYLQRFDCFWTFFENFYSGANGLLRVEPWSDANLYSLDRGRISVAAFNSCAQNDCFSFNGEISREVIARTHLDLKALGPWRLRIAVWHHDIEGPPHRSDYMDPDIIRGMIGRGFRLGLYGHQHQTQVTPQHAHLPERETMAIASAGSLCAGHRDLPAGARRGYSIVEISDDYSSARIHVREMAFANLYTRANLQCFGGRSYVDLDWTTPKDVAGRPEDPVREMRSNLLKQAEDALYIGKDPAQVVQLLSPIDSKSSSFHRKLLLAAAQKLGNLELICEVIDTPQSIEELVLKLDAQLETGNCTGAARTLDEHGARLSLPVATRSALEERIKLNDGTQP